MSESAIHNKLKRQRTDTDTSPAVRSNVIWLEDGNIILQAEGTQFRVHRSILSRHSTVLRDMFLVPQPEGGADETVEGCPVIHLPDSSRDWEHMLDVVYSGNRSFECISFSEISAILRLGHKYEFEPLRDEALARFNEDFPHSFDDFRVTSEFAQRYPLPMDSAHSFSDLVNLAVELHLETSLPGIYLLAILYHDFPSYLYDGTESKDGILSTVSPETQRLLIKSSGKLYKAMVERIFKWLFDDDSMPQPRCRTKSACNGAVRTIMAKLWTPYPNLFAALQPWDQGELCERCNLFAESQHQQGVARFWAVLPSFFDLPPWKELEDFNFIYATDCL